MKRYGFTVFLLLLVLLSSSLAHASQVIVYSPAHENTLARWADLYQRQTGNEVVFVRLSAGEMVARVMAEQSRPRADVVMGIATDFMNALYTEGLLVPSFPENAQFYPADVHHPEGYWYGTDFTVQGIIVNETSFERLFPGRDFPSTWEDFLNPDYQGHFVMPDPVSSGTGYTFLTSHLLRGGEEDWSYLETFAPQVDLFTASGVAPSRLTSMGEYTFGVTFAHDALANINAGFPARFVIPGSVGGTVGVVSAVKGGPNGQEAADHFINWIMSQDAQQLIVDLQHVGSLHESVFLPPGYPDADTIQFVEVDASWASENRERILTQWEEIVDAVY